MKSLYCFDIGGSLIKGGLFSPSSIATEVWTEPTPGSDFDLFCAILDRMVGQNASGVDGISISLTGIIDPANGVLTSANIPSINGRRLEAELAERLKMPVRIANDADCFALAEAKYGAGRGHRTVFGIILGSGVGGGLVMNGKIVTGAGGYAGEWGHGRVLMQKAGTPDRDIPHFPCGCGQSGCVNTVGGARGLEQLYFYMTGHRDSSLNILQQWEAGNDEVRETMDVYLDLVSGPLAMTLNVLGASIVPAGGGLSNSTALLSALDLRTRSRMLRKTQTPIIVKSELTTEPGLIGASVNGFGASNDA